LQLLIIINPRCSFSLMCSFAFSYLSSLFFLVSLYSQVSNWAVIFDGQLPILVASHMFTDPSVCKIGLCWQI